MRIRAAIVGHPYVVGLIALTGAAFTAFVLAYFQPQKLFIDDRVDEPLPAAAPASRPSSAPSRPAIRTLSTGAFRSYEHSSRGEARVIQLADDRRYVRFERFRTSNGPDLRVYLSTTAATGPGDTFDDRYVELGHLKGNVGSQNYAIPARVRLARYASVVVWCKRFSVPFAAAPIR